METVVKTLQWGDICKSAATQNHAASTSGFNGGHKAPNQNARVKQTTHLLKITESLIAELFGGSREECEYFII